jgi:Protein of unknown function (DUF1579)
MRKLVVLAMAVVLAVGALARAEDAPKMPAPQKEHEWLKQLEGEWETEAEMVTEPGKPPVKSKGTESVRSLGGFWSVAEMKGDCLGVPVTGLMTLGYDAQKKKYVGTWVCSVCDWLWKYEGTVNGQVLTLECEGPNPETGKLVKMRDVIEIKDKDHKVLTSSMLGEDGKWVTFMTMTARRKK